MTTGIFWVALLLGTAVGFGMIYGAIRLALIHDRALQARSPGTALRARAPVKGAISTKATSTRWALLAEEERARLARGQEAARSSAEETL